jgi:hypothetical protein
MCSEFHSLGRLSHSPSCAQNISASHWRVQTSRKIEGFADGPDRIAKGFLDAQDMTLESHN